MPFLYCAFFHIYSIISRYLYVFMHVCYVCDFHALNKGNLLTYLLTYLLTVFF